MEELSLNQRFEELKAEAENAEIDAEKLEALKEDIRHLAFEGGGIRGVAFAGAVQFLEEHGIMENITGFAGTSAGAITAALLAVGYTADELLQTLRDTDFEQFRDDSWGVVFDIIRLFTQYGIYKGDAFFQWFSSLMERKTGNAGITFREVHERYGKDLVITGTCLNRASVYLFHHKNDRFADLPVALGVRISMSIPMFWKAVRLGDDVMVDGGVLNNYPIWVFDGEELGVPPSGQEAQRSRTLGFKLMTQSERPDKLYWHGNDEIDGPISYGMAFLNAMLIQIERGHIKDDYWKRTVCINTHDVGSLDFGLSVEKREMLAHEGYVATKNHLICMIEGKENEMNCTISA